MKKIILAVVFALGVCSMASAQNDSFHSFYSAFSFSGGGAPNTNFTTKDFANRFASVDVGYRFTPNFAVFVPVTMEINFLNATTTKNYNQTGTLGLGAAYAIPVGNASYIEPAIAVSSTYLKTDLNYLTPKFEIRWGSIHREAPAYLGLGLQYIRPYGTTTIPNMLLLYATVGVKIF